jgi:hypothetical protein
MKPMKLFVWDLMVDGAPGTVFVIAPDEGEARELACAQGRDLETRDGTPFKYVEPHQAIELIAADTFVEIAGG